MPSQRALPQVCEKR